jgi:hypothetical protein
MNSKFFLCHSKNNSQDNSVSRITGYGLDSWGLIPGKGKIFLFSITYRPALGLAQPNIQWVPWGVKQLGRETDHSNMVLLTSTSPYVLIV